MSEMGGGSDKSEDSSSDSETGAAGGPSSSPPRVDDSPLQKSMDRNKQSLKVKLMMRRPYMQLVDQGIMPPLKTPASFHEQRQKLQRAKMGDLLKHKIQHRPDRTELIRQHILEADTGKVDPSLAERQRMLKRARLADSLNDQLSHRPGPLELIQKNILHTDENVERAVKEGQIPFRATCEGSAIRPTHPFRYVTPEGDDSSSEGGLSPSQDGSLDGSSTSGVVPGTCSGSAETSAACQGGSPSTMASSPSSLSSVASPAAMEPSPPPPPPLPPVVVKKEKAIAPPPPPPPPPPPSSALTLTSGPIGAPVVVKTAMEIAAKNRNRKKSKQKCPPKPRTIKFHEYKGPPNAQKQQSVVQSDVETSYELLLQQQQLFLQWQLEWQHKYPQIILPAKANGVVANGTSSSVSTAAGEVANNLATFLAATAAPPATTLTASTSTGVTSPSASNSEASLTATPATAAAITASAPSSAASTTAVSSINRNSSSSQLNRLEDMKVSDLKAELKKRNLPVSGSKPQLIERLRSFVGGEDSPASSSKSVSRRGSQTQMQIQQQQQQMILDEGPMPSPPPPPSNASRRVSCSSLEGSISSSYRAGSNDLLLPSLSPASSPAVSCCMSPGPASVRPSSVINMDVDIEMNDASNGSATLDAGDVKLEAPPTPPPLPSQPAEQQIGDLVRGLQKEQQVLLEQQQMLRLQAAEEQQQQQQSQTVQLINTNDPKTQQRLLLQQHLQLKIQQQQIQQQLEQLQQLQQQASPSSPAPTKTTSSRAAARVGRNAAKLQATRTIVPASTSSSLPSQSTSSNGNNELGAKPLVFNLVAEPTSLTQSRRPPPPNYTEASRLLQQQPVGLSTTNSSSSSSFSKPRVSIKSQLVDDVLDILIRNGELPPSAAHDPVTPTTPRDPPPMPPPLPPHLLSKHHQQQLQQQQQQQLPTEIKFPYIDINDLGLDLDSLGEAMELGVYDNHPETSQQQQQQQQQPSSTTMDEGRNDEVSAMEMDVADWLDTLLPPLASSQPLSSGSSVASSTSSTTSGFSSIGSDQLQQHPYLLHHQHQLQHSANNNNPFSSQLPQQHHQQQQMLNEIGGALPSHLNHQQHISGDPLFSSLSSDPYTDLFALDDTDMKLPTGLGNTLSWDRLDFTA